MIKKPTVFVLGAGASAPYEFPVDLNQAICSAVPEGRRSSFLSALIECGIGAKEVEDFVARLRPSPLSVDEFIVRHQQYRDVGKLAIAAAVAPCERDAALWTWYEAPGNLKALRWYDYLFRNMLRSATDLCEMERNRLTVITFNFDRSFERALFNFVLTNCVDDFDEERARTIARAIPVYHVHGQLGTPRWIVGDAPGSRDYTWDSSFAPDVLKASAASIRILDDEVEGDPVVTAAREALNDADQICFLGFSYHPLNLPKLMKSDWKEKRVLGTFYQVDEGHIPAIEEAFLQNANVKIEKNFNHVATFLRTDPVIHD